jgi:group I intron endonuclease
MLSVLNNPENIFQKKPGIYCIINSINGNKYVGQSNNIRRRFIEHRLAKNTSCRLLSLAIKKYGIENFSFAAYEYCSLEQLNEKEILYIKELNPQYNISEGGKGAKGHSVSSNTKSLLSEKSKAWWNSLSVEQQQEVISNNLTGPRKGHLVSEETKQKLRKANLGKKQSPESILKRSEKMKIAMRGNQNGKKHN